MNKTILIIVLIALVALSVISFLVFNIFTTKILSPANLPPQLVTHEDEKGGPYNLEVNVKDYTSSSNISGAKVMVQEPVVCLSCPGCGCIPENPRSMKVLTDDQGTALVTIPSLKFLVLKVTALGYKDYPVGPMSLSGQDDLKILVETVDNLKKQKTVDIRLIPESAIAVSTEAQALQVAPEVPEVKAWLSSHPYAMGKAELVDPVRWRVRYTEKGVQCHGVISGRGVTEDQKKHGVEIYIRSVDGFSEFTGYCSTY